MAAMLVFWLFGAYVLCRGRRCCALCGGCLAFLALVQAISCGRVSQSLVLGVGAEEVEGTLVFALVWFLVFAMLLGQIRNGLLGEAKEASGLKEAFRTFLADKKAKAGRLPKERFFVAAALFLLMLCSTACLFAAKTAGLLFLCLLLPSVLGLAFVSAGLCRLYGSFVKKEKENRILRRDEEGKRLQKQQREAVAAANEQARRLRHDMKNSYQLLYGLLEQGKTKEALEWLSKEECCVGKIPTVVYTERETINALLNAKQALARKSGIGFTVRITTDFYGIGDYDLGRLLGNLADNAIEAAARCPETGGRAVDLKLSGDSRRFLLEITNPTAAPVLQDGQLPVTGKGDAQAHGLGHTNVEEIVEKYNGSVKYEEPQDGQFRVFLMLFRKKD